MNHDLEQTIQKASVLVEALPYIRAFFGKTFVIKYGGSTMGEAADRSVALDVTLLRYVGVKPVLVHGGGPAITEMMRSLGKQPRFVNGRRVTDAETMQVVRMVMMGSINMDIVATINQFGGRAVGLSGHDGQLIVARKRMERAASGEAGAGGTVDLGYVGDVEAIHPEILHQLTDLGYIPVVAPIGVGHHGESYNINADYRT
ncbi:MAG TPA: acetylglutamate kinase [Limnochordales bacterium]